MDRQWANIIIIWKAKNESVILFFFTRMCFRPRVINHRFAVFERSTPKVLFPEGKRHVRISMTPTLTSSSSVVWPKAQRIRGGRSPTVIRSLNLGTRPISGVRRPLQTGLVDRTYRKIYRKTLISLYIRFAAPAPAVYEFRNQVYVGILSILFGCGFRTSSNNEWLVRSRYRLD